MIVFVMGSVLLFVLAGLAIFSGNLLGILLGIIFLVCGVMFLRYAFETAKEKRNNKKLGEQ